MFRWQREPEPAWRAELYAIGGAPNQQAAYFDLFWWPGEPHSSGARRQDVQRWTVVECLPEAALTKTPHHKAQARELLNALHGAPPVTLRSWVVRKGERVIQSKARVSQWQWELFRKTGCYAQPYWIVQGVHGGHLWSFPPAYQMLLRMTGRPLNPPVPGALPYAEWDSRVRDQLGRERTLREWLERFRTREQTRKTDRDHKKEDIQLEREGRRQLLAWLDQQLGQATEPLGSHLSKVDLPTAPADADVTDEQLEAADAEIVAATPTSEADL